MTTIDERIVSMKFNNGQFMNGIKSTLDGLAGLKKGLNLDAATKSVQDLNAAGQRFDLGPMSTAIEGVSGKFLALATIGVTALAAITSRALAAGGQLAKSITIDPIRAGLDEYETNLNSIQTILANTGLEGEKGLGKVQHALEELNHYSDQTIYNFSEMARNIGTFTAAGVDLETSTNAIKGIANLAAISGSNSQQASTAMYQLSQALAAGKVSLMDWNSVVNAGMGGKVFQEALKETARVHGVAVDQIIKEQGSFRDSLQTGWITSEILTETLSKFTGDLTASQLKTMGYNEDQIEGILKMGRTATNAATKVKTMSQLISTLQETAQSGWAKTWELLFGNFNEAKKLFTGVNDVLGDMIGSSNDARNELIREWKELGGRAVAIEAIKNAFDALMQIIKPIREAFSEIFPAATAKQLLNMTESIRDFTENLKIGAETSKNLKRIFRGVFAAFDIGIEIIKGIVGVLGDMFGAATEGSAGVLDFAGNIGDFIVELRDAIKSGEGFAKFFEGLGKVLSAPIDLVREFITLIAEAFSGDGVATGGMESALERIQQRFEPFTVLGQRIADVWGGIWDTLKGVFGFMAPFADAVGNAFSQLGTAVSNSIKTGDFSQVLDAINTGLFAGLVLVLKKFLSNGINLDFGGGFFSNVSGAFEELTGTLSAMQAQLKAGALLKIAGAIGILTASVVALSLIDSAALTKSLTAMTVMFTQLFTSMAIFEKISAGAGFAKMPIVTGAMILLATALVILTAAVKNLSEIEWEGLAKGLTGVTALLGALAGSAKLLSGSAKGLIPAGIGMAAMAVGIKILASAVKDFSEMSWGDLGKGLAATAAGLGIIAAAMRFMPVSMPLTAVGLVAVSAALVIMGAALKIMASMSWEEIAKGLVALAGSLTIIAVAVTAMIATLPGAAALVVVSGALLILGLALKNMGGMEWSEVAVALVALAGSLLIIAVAVTAMVAALPGAAALAIVAASMALLAPALIAMGKMSWEEIGKGLLMLAAAFTIIGLAGLALTPVIPSLLGLGAAIALIGIGTLAAGVGLLAFSAGLTALSVAGAAGAAALVAIVSSLIGLIPMAMEAVGRGIIAFAETISKAGPQFTRAITTVLLSLINAIGKVGPRIIEVLYSLILKLVNTIATNVPKFVDAGLRMITGILTGIGRNIGKIADAATTVIVNFVNAIAKNANRIVQAGYDMIIDFINSLANTIRTNQPKVDAAMRNLADAMIDAFLGSIGNVAQIGTDIVRGIASGITGGIGTVTAAARDLANNALDAAKSALGIHSPSREFQKLGVFVNKGFAKGLTGSRDEVRAAYNTMKGLLKDAIQSTNAEMQEAREDLKKLTEAREKDTEAIKKAEKALAKAKKENELAKGARSTLTKNLDDEKKRLEGLAAEYERVSTRLDEARKKLTDAKKTRDDYTASIKDQYSDLEDITEETDLETYFKNLQKQIADVNTFASKLQKLRDMGLNDTLYKELLAQGPEAMNFVDQILEGGKSNVADLNKLSSQLDSAAGKLGKTAGKELYQAGVDIAQGLVNGLEKKQDRLDKVMERIAEKMVTTIKKKLGIKSPSREFAKIGGYSAEGLRNALDKSTNSVAKSAENLGDNALKALKKSMSNVSDAVSADLDTNPTIRPVLDLTDVQKASNNIPKMLSTSPLDIDASYAKASAVAARVSATQQARVEREELLMEAGDTFIFEQHNTSPKSLSTAEIYRQTKNQISVVKERLPK